MKIFKTKGFDTLIGKGTTISGTVALHGCTIIDGCFNGESIHSDGTSNTLVVNGTVTADKAVMSHNLTVSGTITAKEVTVSGVLEIKQGGRLTADVISYRTLLMQSGAVVIGQLRHADGDAISEVALHP